MYRRSVYRSADERFWGLRGSGARGGAGGVWAPRQGQVVASDLVDGEKQSRHERHVEAFVDLKRALEGVNHARGALQLCQVPNDVRAL